MAHGTLWLIPTPIEEIGEISSSLKNFLQGAFENGSVLAVEDAKPARRRWLGWGLPREAIESFILYNEHSREQRESEVLSHLLGGQDVFLMSDGGLPGFCDPGRSLIFECHQKRILVKMFSFPNSLMAAVTLSGFTEGAFQFHGFPPKEKEKRVEFFKSLAQTAGVHSFMDTPYRLERVFEECLSNLKERDLVSVSLDIGRETEEIIWGSPKQIRKQLKAKPPGKREFVFVVKVL